MIEYPTNNSFLIVFLLLCTSICAAPQQQLMKLIPGYPGQYSKTHRAWSGYLDTSSSQRSLHYIFMQNLKEGEDNKLPVLLWLNGGPGCSSKLGFLQQIAPYYMEDGAPYKPDSDLKENSFSWLNLTNLLFIDSPAGVGYSINADKNYKYNDANTAKDNVIALANFFKKFEGYRKNYLILSGQSYAGKYIPDLAVAIDNYNAANPSLAMNLKGLLIGNPVIDFQSGSLYKSQKYFMFEHNFIDKKLIETYERSCLKDLQSAGCQYFNTRYDDLIKYIDPFNIYGPCYNQNQNKNSQEKFVLTSAKFFSTSSNQNEQVNRIRKTQILNNLEAVECFYDKGIKDYFTITSNIEAFNSKKSSFQVCNDEIYESYQQTPSGSINQLARIINQNKLKVALFSGDWDGVVPLLDTLKNMDKLSLRQQGKSMQWSVSGQHAGFIRIYSNNFKIYVVKGAGRSVPQFQRERAYDMLQKYLSQL